jgi:hypothetical protein
LHKLLNAPGIEDHDPAGNLIAGQPAGRNISRGPLNGDHVKATLLGSCVYAGQEAAKIKPTQDWGDDADAFAMRHCQMLLKDSRL